MKNHTITINSRKIGHGEPVYVIAEMSANHGQDFNRAVEIIHAMKESGADAVKLQTYTPDTMTIDSDHKEFRIGKGTIWEGKTLYELYGEAYTPWEWQPKLKKVANDLGMDLFSTPFDSTAVDFLEEMNVSAYKVASFELIDIPLIERIAQTGKPMIMSTGMGSFEEIQKAVEAAREAGAKEIALLKCTSAYPAPPEEINLRTIPDLMEKLNVPVGLSDHTLGIAVPVAAVALDACIVEKHFTMSRDDPGPDSAFSLEPDEFKQMVGSVRIAKKALGEVSYDVTEKEQTSRVFRRSIFSVKDIREGEEFTGENIRIIRPGHGLHPKELSNVLGRKAAKNISRGTPLSWELVE